MKFQDDSLPGHFWLSLAGALLAFSAIFYRFSELFWMQMAAASFALCCLVFFVDPNKMREQLRRPPHYWLFTIVAGLLSALVLYGVFAICNGIVGKLFASATDQISSIYSLKSGKSSIGIGLLLACIIAPGEEIFWRAYVQRHLTKRYEMLGIGMAAIAYAAVHVASGNVMLSLAALICGLFWGAMYYYGRSLWLNIVSHIVWDLAILVVFPLM